LAGPVVRPVQVVLTFSIVLPLSELVPPMSLLPVPVV
jgi:hypothetical protein